MAVTEHQTLQDWPIVAQAAGLDPAAYRVSRIAIRDDGAPGQVTLELTAADRPGLMARQMVGPADNGQFLALVTAQDRAATALAGHPTTRVPPVLAHDAARRLLLTPLVGGESALAALEGSTDHGATLVRCGAWAAAFHAAGPTEQRRFQPRYMTEHLARLAAEVTAGKRSVAAKGQFLALVLAVQARAAQAEGAPTVSALRHGDLQTRNLRFDGDLTWGLNLSSVQSAPVGYDIARCLIDYAWTSANLEQMTQGEMLPAAATEAFFDGYRLTGPADESVRFLMAVRIALDWAALPPDPDRMSVAKVIQFRRMQRVAAIAFG